MLKENLEHHPDVTRFAMENPELRGTVRSIVCSDLVNLLHVLVFCYL